MSERWTPGPWHVELVPGSYKQPALVISGERVVAQCVGDQLDPAAASIGEAKANARLIAAAPDLYAALVAAEEELRLIHMKDTGAIYNPALRPQITLALADGDDGGRRWLTKRTCIRRTG